MRKHQILNLCVVALVVGTVVIAAACGGQNGGKPTAEVPSQNQPEVGVPTDDQRQTAAPVENERTGNPQVLADIPVGSQPVGIALNPVTNRVYVANSKSASVSVIDARSDLPPENESRSNVTLQRENRGYWTEERGHLNWTGGSTRLRRSSAS
jgi:DNA-binding beta-propeller fold protein YncE